MTKPMRKSRTEILRARRVLDLDAVQLPTGLIDLATGQDIEIVRAGETRGARKVDADTARRLDVFLCIALPNGSYEAARRLERDMYARRGEDDKGASYAPVDASTGRCRQDLMLEASDRVTNALRRIGGRDAFLMTELIYPGIPGELWRRTVLRVTSEENPVAQTAAIRAACANLAAAYAEIDR